LGLGKKLEKGEGNAKIEKGNHRGGKVFVLIVGYQKNIIRNNQSPDNKEKTGKKEGKRGGMGGRGFEGPKK